MGISKVPDPKSTRNVLSCLQVKIKPQRECVEYNSHIHSGKQNLRAKPIKLKSRKENLSAYNFGKDF